MNKTIVGYLAFLFFVSGAAFGADSRYVLSEYSMDNCPACVAALKDVAALTEQGIDVRCFNTDRDKSAAEECRKQKLLMRPAWRLTRADGKEIGRWYGSGKSGIIAATIQAKFPQPDEILIEAPIEQTTASQIELPDLPPLPEEGTDASTEPQAAEPFVAPPVLNASVPSDPLQEDFRNRSPVVDRYSNAGVLDDFRSEWNDRRRDPSEPEKKENDRFLFRGGEPDDYEDAPGGLGSRIADRAAAKILDGLNARVDEIKRDALGKLDAIGDDAKDALVGEFRDQLKDVRRDLAPTLESGIEQIKKAILAKLKEYALLGFFAVLLAAALALLIYRAWKETARP